MVEINALGREQRLHFGERGALIVNVVARRVVRLGNARNAKRRIRKTTETIGSRGVINDLIKVNMNLGRVCVCVCV